MCLEDIELLSGIAATWDGRDRMSIVFPTLEMLLGMLQLDLVGLRLNDAAEFISRVSPTFGDKHDAGTVFAMLDHSPFKGPQHQTTPLIGGEDLHIVSLPLGKLASIGTLIAASRRPGFPRRDEMLRLSTAAMCASLSCREAREIIDSDLAPDVRLDSRGTALAESERSLNLIINTIPAMAWSATPEGMLDFANQHFLDFIGSPFEAVRGLNFYQILHPEDSPHLLSVWQAIMASKQGQEIEGRIKRADGEYRWCTLRQKPLLDSRGRVIKWYGVVLEIEDRKRAEDALKATESALQASEQNLSLIINSLPVLIWSARPDGSADFINKEWIDYAGVPAEKILEWGFLDLYHPEDIPSMVEIWKRDLESSDHTLLKGRIRGADGTYRWFYFSGRKLTDANGEVRWFGVNVDIEDLQRAENALRESEAALRDSERNLRLIIDTVPAMAWSATHDGQLDFWNRYLSDYVGLGFEEIVGDGFYRIFHPDDVETMRSAWNEILTTKIGQPVDARIKRADGEYRWFTLRQSPLLDAQGNVVRWYGIIIDIEDRRRAEEDLRQSQSDLAHVARMTTMGELAVSIAHEVNQPLMAIVTSASTCLRWLDDAQTDVVLAREAAERIVRDGHRAGDIIASIRALARKAPQKMERIELDLLIQQVLDLLKGELARRDIVVKTAFERWPTPVIADVTQLQQVVLNLIMNSAEAMADVTSGRRRLTIRTVNRGDFVQVSILDNGVGLSREHFEQVFEAFFTSKPEGIGMGLSICRSIVDAHGGRIWAAQNSPAGSAFSFTLPLAKEVSAHARPN